MSSRDEATSTPLGPGAEFDVIRELLARWKERAIGIGDDAAMLIVPRGDMLVASVDTSIEGQHFRAGWLTATEIGYRAVTAAMSDLAAMAATPMGILVALGLPSHWRSAVVGLAEGIGDAVDAAGARILGGNVSPADELSITTTVLGSAFEVLRRDGLRDGDTLYVTGTLGGPGAALAAWDSGDSPAPAHRARFAHPVARVREARWLADRGATAAIDLSDGLAADLQHLAAASHVRLDVDLSRVPRVDGVSDAEAAASGEEYELVVGASMSLDVDAFAATFGIPLTAIGRASAEAEGLILRSGPGS